MPFVPSSPLSPGQVAHPVTTRPLAQVAPQRPILASFWDTLLHSAFLATVAPAAHLAACHHPVLSFLPPHSLLLSACPSCALSGRSPRLSCMPPRSHGCCGRVRSRKATRTPLGSFCSEFRRRKRLLPGRPRTDAPLHPDRLCPTSPRAAPTLVPGWRVSHSPAPDTLLALRLLPPGGLALPAH